MTTYNIPGAINDTGAVDVTADILAWIATIPDGTLGSPNTVVLGATKTYRVDGVFGFESRNYLDFEGQGSTFQTDVTGESHRYHWGMTFCTGINVNELTIRGANALGGLADGAYVAALEFQHGFTLWSCNDIRIHHCQASQMYGDYVRIGSFLPGGGYSDNIEIDNNYFFNNGRQGFALVGCSNVEIHHNVTGEAQRALMDFEPTNATTGSHDVHVHDNTFGQHRLAFIACKGMPGIVHDIIIEDNTCWKMNVLLTPTGFGLRYNWLIQNNVASALMGGISGAALIIKKSNFVTIINNTQPMQVGKNMYMAKFSDCEDFVCSGNIIPNGVGQYIVVDTPTGPEADPVSALPSTPPTVIATSTSTGDLTAALTITLPTGSVVGDEILIWVGHQGSYYADLLDPGWTLVGDMFIQPGSTGQYYCAVQRTIDQTAINTGSYTFTFHEGSSLWRSSAIAVTIRGITNRDPAFILETIDPEDSSSSNVLPGATTTERGNLVVFFFGHRGGNPFLTVEAGLSPQATVRNGSSGGVSLGFGSVVYTGIGQGMDRMANSSMNGFDCGLTLAYAGTVLADIRRRVHMVNRAMGAAGGIKVPLSAASKTALG